MSRQSKKKISSKCLPKKTLSIVGLHKLNSSHQQAKAFDSIRAKSSSCPTRAVKERKNRCLSTSIPRRQNSTISSVLTDSTDSKDENKGIALVRPKTSSYRPNRSIKKNPWKILPNLALNEGSLLDIRPGTAPILGEDSMTCQYFGKGSISRLQRQQLTKMNQAAKVNRRNEIYAINRILGEKFQTEFLAYTKKKRDAERK